MRPKIRLLVRMATLLGLVGVLLLLPLSTFAAPPPAPETATVYVTAHLGLRLRQSANLSSPVILTLSKGQAVHTLAAPVFNQGISWTFVRVWRWGHAYDGYCASAYLSDYPGPTPTGETGLRVTAGAGLRLRAGPGLGYATRRIVPAGTILQPTGITQWGSGILWTKVSFNGTFLWAAQVYLQPV
jgi:hypothetical protein